jgi:hypothetical protein
MRLASFLVDLTRVVCCQLRTEYPHRLHTAGTWLGTQLGQQMRADFSGRVVEVDREHGVFDVK